MTYNRPPDSRTFVYVTCLNPACPDRERCLRALALEKVRPEQTSIHTIAPGHYPAPGEACPHFRPAQKVQIAWGMRRLYDDMTRLTAQRVHAALEAHFGYHGYYRARRGERPILPADQEAVRRIFRAHGIEADPVYDSVTEDYLW